MARIDIAVPCYNYGRYLRDCVGSILRQGIPDLRIAIIDNASTDDSLDTAYALAAEDHRVEVIAHERNLGPHASYNRGIDWAESDFFLILDADDLLTPGSLRRAIDVLDRHPEVGFVHGHELKHAFEAGCIPAVVVPPEVKESLEGGLQFITRLCGTPVNCIEAPTVVRRTSLQKRIGHYRPALPYTDDLEMWLRLATQADVATIPCVQAIRRLHLRRASNHFQSVQVRDFVEREKAFASFFDREGRSLPDADRMLRLAGRRLGQHAYWSAISHAIRGQTATARTLFEFANQRNPLGRLVPPVTWLLRMQNPLRRAVDILSETTTRALGR